MENNERCTITCGESGDGLEDTVFSSGSFTVEDCLKLGTGNIINSNQHVRCVTGQKVVAGLFRGQSTDGRKDTKGIAS